MASIAPVSQAAAFSLLQTVMVSKEYILHKLSCQPAKVGNGELSASSFEPKTLDKALRAQLPQLLWSLVIQTAPPFATPCQASCPELGAFSFPFHRASCPASSKRPPYTNYNRTLSPPCVALTTHGLFWYFLHQATRNLFFTVPFFPFVSYHGRNHGRLLARAASGKVSNNPLKQPLATTTARSNTILLQDFC